MFKFLYYIQKQIHLASSAVNALSPFVAYCVCGCDKVCVFEWEQRNSEKPRGGFPLKGSAFLLPLWDSPSFPPLLPSLSFALTRTQTLRAAEEAKEKWKRVNNLRPSVPHTQTCRKSLKNGMDFTYFSVKATRCHVGVLQPTSVVEALNMASLLAHSRRRLSGEDYQDQKWRNFLSGRGETPANMVNVPP